MARRQQHSGSGPATWLVVALLAVSAAAGAFAQSADAKSAATKVNIALNFSAGRNLPERRS